MVDFVSNFQNAFGVARQRRIEDEALSRQNQVQRLLGDSLSAPADARGGYIAEIARLDPSTALTLRSGFQQEEAASQKAGQERLVNMARLFSSAPAQARGTMWQQLRPGLQQMGLDAPEQWDDTMLPVVQTLGGVTEQEGNLSPRMRSINQALRDGLISPEQHKQATLIELSLAPGAAQQDFGTLVDVPVVRNGVRGTEKRIWRGGQLLPLDQATMGGGMAPAPMGSTPAPRQSGSPNMDAVLAQANEMARRGVPDADIERYIASAAQQAGVQVTPTQAQIDANAQRTIQSQTFGAPAPMPAPAAAPAADSFGFVPEEAPPRRATPAELAELRYAPTDIVEINANGVPRPIRVAEAPGAKAPSAETANKVSLYDNALRAANEWRSLVVNSDGSFNDVAARTPQAKALLNQALRAKLRAESGASISQEEIGGETDRYMGGLFSSDATAAQQANALIDDLTNQRAALDPSGMIRPAIPAQSPQRPAAGGVRIISVTPAGQR